MMWLLTLQSKVVVAISKKVFASSKKFSRFYDFQSLDTRKQLFSMKLPGENYDRKL